MRKILVALSGGMDSTTALHAAVREVGPDNVYTIGFSYGSKHSTHEIRCAANVADYFKVPYHLLDIRSAMVNIKSALLASCPDEPVPEGHYQEETMRQTVVPGRNLIMLAILAGIAESQGYSTIFIGAHSGDHYIYPDCRPEFIEHADLAIYHGSGQKVSITAPFLNGNKTTIIKDGLEWGTPYHLTRTCYKDQGIACGVCGSCQERLEAFAENGVADPIEYETRELLPKKSAGG